MKPRRNPVPLSALRPGAEFIFHGADNKDYRASVISAPSRGLVKIRYAGFQEINVPVKSFRERLFRKNPTKAPRRKTARRRSNPGPNPVNVHARRLPSGRTRVRSRGRVTAYGTTRKRGARQIRLLRGLAHGWKPRPGIPARDVRQAVARLGNETMAFRKKRKWSVIRGSVAGGKFHVIAKNLNDQQLRKWYLSHGYKAKSL